MYRIDLHTHSSLSPDGGISEAGYRRILESRRLDYVAVTDHNEVWFALKLQKILGEKIIVGEEINTGDGEIIGLFLQKKIEPMLGADQTIIEIRRQKGLVYIPHPFESVRRKGVQAKTLKKIIDRVDIIEIHNGRAYFNKKSEQAKQWTKTHDLAGAASSDAHGIIGWGRTFSIIEQMPTRQNLAGQLAGAESSQGYVGLIGILYPSINRLKRRLQK